jgi:hypothetical protein
VDQTVGIVNEWLVPSSPLPVSECAAMDDTRALTASDVRSAADVCRVLDLTRYPEEAAGALKSEVEREQQQEEEAKKEEEERLKAEAEAKKKTEEEADQRRVAAAAAAATAFRRRCYHAAAAVCTLLLLLLLLQRAGRMPLRLRRLLAALLYVLRRR